MGKRQNPPRANQYRSKIVYSANTRYKGCIRGWVREALTRFCRERCRWRARCHAGKSSVPCFARRSLTKSGNLISRERHEISGWNLHWTILYRLSCLFILLPIQSRWQFPRETRFKVRAPATRRMRLTENQLTFFFDFLFSNSWRTRDDSDVITRVYSEYFVKSTDVCKFVIIHARRIRWRL